jgi:hypothetical protein
MAKNQQKEMRQSVSPGDELAATGASRDPDSTSVLRGAIFLTFFRENRRIEPQKVTASKA